MNQAGTVLFDVLDATPLYNKRGTEKKTPNNNVSQIRGQQE